MSQLAVCVPLVADRAWCATHVCAHAVWRVSIHPLYDTGGCCVAPLVVNRVRGVPYVSWHAVWCVRL